MPHPRVYISRGDLGMCVSMAVQLDNLQWSLKFPTILQFYDSILTAAQGWKGQVKLYRDCRAH